jgi:hypothetical protein
MTFKLYTEAFSGTPIWTETQSVTCDKGIFSTRLGKVTPLPYADRFQSLLLLGITPEGADHELFPRVMLTAAPYAMSLLPGATIVDSESEADYIYSLRVDSYYRNAFNASTSIANGVGVSGVADGPAEGGSHPKGVSGFSETGYGVYGASENYFGVYGEGVNGVYGETTGENGSGVYGYGAYTDTLGVVGVATAFRGIGVYGLASNSGLAGVYGYNYNYFTCTPYDTDCPAGVVAQGAGGGLALFAYAENNSAVRAVSDHIGYSTGYFNNLQGVDHPGLDVGSSARISGDLIVYGSKSGYVVDVALNAGEEQLERGDVVMVVGMEAPIMGEIPVMRVIKTTPETASGIVGVVDVLYEHYDLTAEQLAQGQSPGRFNHDVTTIQPGQYLSVVTLGAYQWIKVDATDAPIHAGDLLSISTTPGVAAKAQQITIDGYSFYAPGTIIGKALQDLESGTGVIAVFVSLK